MKCTFKLNVFIYKRRYLCVTLPSHELVFFKSWFCYPVKCCLFTRMTWMNLRESALAANFRADIKFQSYYTRRRQINPAADRKMLLTALVSCVCYIHARHAPHARAAWPRPRGPAWLTVCIQRYINNNDTLAVHVGHTLFLSVDGLRRLYDINHLCLSEILRMFQCSAISVSHHYEFRIHWSNKLEKRGFGTV